MPYAFAAVAWVIVGTWITGYGDLISFEDLDTMKLTLNILGLIFITVGGIGAAICTPAPRYNSDGSVSLSGEMDTNRRIAVHKRQKLLPRLLALVGVGAGLQLVAVLL